MQTTQQQTAITTIESWVQKKLKNDKTGHDWHHITQVIDWSEEIANCLDLKPGSNDRFLVRIIATLHEALDTKLVKNTQKAGAEVRHLLEQHLATPFDRDKIFESLKTISYSKSVLLGKPLTFLPAQIVQDADFLTALGQLGIYRAIAYSTSIGRPFYNPAIPWRKVTPENYRDCPSTLHHIEEKILKLLENMNTEPGRTFAEPLHNEVLNYFNKSLLQWQTRKIS